MDTERKQSKPKAGSVGKTAAPSRPTAGDRRGSPRVRQLGIKIGQYPPGRHNAITDVPGVRVGHTTLVSGKGPLRVGKGPVRTGVTAILPNEGNIFLERVVGSGFILNGAGEVSGLTQVNEWGLIETPILLTNTLSVGICSAATVEYLVKQYPSIGVEHDVVIPVVGECDDSWLNDAGGQHLKAKHVFEAIEKAVEGPVEEGSVGGGTGMITCDFKGGMGTASRKLPQQEGGYVVGVLVMSNFGRMRDLRIDGLPVGKVLAEDYSEFTMRKDCYGSIIVVLATNAPLWPNQITRLCRRAALGIGRVGSYAAHRSGEIIVGFSTANKIPRETRKMIYRMKVLLDRCIDPLYRAIIEATEEAILNALCAAEAMEGHSGHFAPALPVARIREIMERWQASAGQTRSPSS